MTDQERSTWQQYRQELFNHFAQNHDLHLLSSELDEIECIVARKPAEAFPAVDKAIAEYLETHLDVEHLESDAFAADICLLFAPAIAEVVAENERLKAACAAMREALERIEKFEKKWGPHSLTDWNEVVATCKQSLSTTDAGKSLLDRLKKAESEASDLKESLALELAENIKLFDLLGLKTPGCFEHNTSTEAVTIKVKELLDRLQALEAERDEYSTALAMICSQPPKYAKPIAEAALERKALQPAQKEQ